MRLRGAVFCFPVVLVFVVVPVRSCGIADVFFSAAPEKGTFEAAGYKFQAAVDRATASATAHFSQAKHASASAAQATADSIASAAEQARVGAAAAAQIGLDSVRHAGHVVADGTVAAAVAAKDAMGDAIHQGEAKAAEALHTVAKKLEGK